MLREMFIVSISSLIFFGFIGVMFALPLNFYIITAVGSILLIAYGLANDFIILRFHKAPAPEEVVKETFEKGKGVFYLSPKKIYPLIASPLLLYYAYTLAVLHLLEASILYIVFVIAYGFIQPMIVEKSMLPPKPIRSNDLPYFILTLIFFAVFSLSLSAVGGSLFQSSVIYFSSVSPPVFLTWVLIASIVEELVFRATELYSLVVDFNLSETIASMIISFAFTLFHAYVYAITPEAFVYLFFFSFLISMLTLQTKNPTYAYILHFLNNLIAGLSLMM